MSSSSSSSMALLFSLAFFCLAFAAADENEDSSSEVLTGHNLSDKVQEQDLFVMFYAPWCGHCKRLHPTWSDLSKKINADESKEVVIGKVDCTAETALCSDHEVTGYPTLKYFKKGKIDEAEKYKGGRDLAALTKFVDKKLGLESDDDNLIPSTPTTENGLTVLNEKNFASHVAKGDHFVKFYAPWCGHCKKLAPTWAELAEHFEADKDVDVAKLDCTEAQAVCQGQGVKGYPTLVYYRDGLAKETYKGARTMKELKDYVLSMKEEKDDKKDDQNAEKIPEPSPAGADKTVPSLNVDNFKDSIASGTTFVKFFAPWCGHCKRLAPTWDELAAKFESVEGVTIAKVDCTQDENRNKDLCTEQGVNGFPTLNLYKDGKKVKEYNGKRSLDDLVKFVEDELKTQDKNKDEL